MRILVPRSLRIAFICVFIAVTVLVSSAAVAVAETLTWAPTQPAYFAIGQSAVISGSLVDTAAPVAGRVVHVYGTAGIDATTSCDVAGRFAVTVSPSTVTTYSAWLESEPSVSAGQLRVVPHAILTKLPMPKTLKKGKPWVSTFSIRTSCRNSVTKITIVGQRLEKGKWRRRATWIAHISFGAYSDQSAVFYPAHTKFSKKGRWRIRAETPTTAYIGGAVSPWAAFKVK